MGDKSPAAPVKSQGFTTTDHGLLAALRSLFFVDNANGEIPASKPEALKKSAKSG
jgi:hypothetical protein